ncbi:multidrug ABC transporter ATP-binding protein, partial [[Eubacterium] rectale]|nr:multidrug ABC transporter ATP-binding protein [Agathobacter rectalis]
DSQNSIWAELDSVFAPLHELERQLHELENQLGTLTPKAADYQDVLASYDRLSEQFKKQGGYEYASRMRGVLHGFG